MSPVHFSLPRLLLLLHATAATVLGDVILTETADIQNVTYGDMTVSEATTNRPTEKTRVIPEGTSHSVVRPRVRLFCLENGKKVLVCDPGPHQAAPIQWTLDGKDLEGKDLEGTQADFQHNSKTITLATGVLGNISCKIRHDAVVMPSYSINTACDGENWIFYSTIMAAAGGGAFLLSLIVCAAACCCRRRSGHLPLKQEEIELGAVVVEEEKKPKVKEVHEVEETKPMTNKTTPNVETAEDGFHFPTPPDMNCLTPEEDGKVTMEEGQNTSATGSEDGSTDGHEDKMAENESSDVHGN